ncbi:group II intron reverse transcriptase/maturase, partial [Companilactobacillus furfuricola]|uniref:group II intron reverse transcriptase/maturase n=1 Tax=Companilactobacillus furfuricola TaxID=1462575 RepID=UPI000F77E7D0
MRKSQKTGSKSGQLGTVGLENQGKPEVRSAVSGESTIKSGISLKEQILSRDNLNLAYQRVYRNKGAQGIDGMTVYDLKDYIKKNKTQLMKSLNDLTYKPKPVRRVEIPKPDGSMRKLGVPTVIDRLIQQAVAQAMMPVFENIFSDNSFGFRPNRSAHDAINRVTEFYDQGYHVVIDLDLKAYFDTVNHDLLMKFIKQYIDDEWLLRMIRKFLTSGVMDGKLFQKSTEGTPQGGNLSPLLANIYLNELDKILTSRGHKFVRYADDCNIYVKSKRAGERVLESVSNFLKKDLKLTINRKKTTVGNPRRLKFLGFSVGVSQKGAYPIASNQSKKRLIHSLKTITKRNRGRSLDIIFLEIQRKMNGWLNYYGIAGIKTFVQRLDEWLRSRIRQYIWKSWKQPKTRYK